VPQRADVVEPGDALAADEADVTASIGYLNVGDEQMHELAPLRLPDHLLVDEASAALA
jgi:hypothetical protein